jgi:DNA replication protein DnaC
LKHIHSDGTHAKSIIELFKSVDKSTFVCQHCKRESDLKFNPVFLAYDTNRTNCSTCEAKIEKAIKEQKIIEKTKALYAWKKDREFAVNTMISMTGTPVIFRSAKLEDLDSAISSEVSTEQSYFINGAVGVGKTYMAVAIMREYLRLVKPEYDEQRKEYYYHPEMPLPIFIEVPELLLRIRDTYNDKSNETEKDIVEFYSSAPFLVLDDLGTEKASEFSTLMIYLIINRRSTANLTTIITSNLNLEEIRERLSDRISSRIKGLCRELTVAGDDKRYKNEREQGKN